MNYKRLYIIGNGFDIHHGINSKYSQFKKWLEDNQDEYNALYLLYNHFHVDGDFWNEFENSLSKFNISEFAENETQENYPDFTSDNFARELDMAIYQSEQDFVRITDEIKCAFHDWICSLNSPNPQKQLNLHAGDSFFINFNYTKTLENLYHIPTSHICHIHGCVDSDEGFILGHGEVVSESSNSDELPDYCDTPEKIEAFYDSHYDPVLDNVTETIVNSVNTFLKKDVQGNIDNHYDIFRNLNLLEEMHIYGWSFSPIDTPYLDEILKNNDMSKLYWNISWYSENDKVKANMFLSKYGVDTNHISFVKLDDLMDKSQLSLF